MEDKREWYEKDFPPTGILCWVSDNDKKIRIDAVLQYNRKAYMKFYTYTYSYIYATPLTKEEVLERLLEVEND